MNASLKKHSIFHVLHVALSMAGLVAAVIFYVRHKDTPQGTIGLVLLVSAIILSVVFRIIGVVFKFILLLLFLALGYFFLRQHFKLF